MALHNRRKVDDKDLNRPTLRKAPGAGTTIDGDDKARRATTKTSVPL